MLSSGVVGSEAFAIDGLGLSDHNMVILPLAVPPPMRCHKPQYKIDKITPIQIYHAFRLMELSEHISIINSADQSSELQFTANQYELDLFQRKNPKFNALIQFLLRSYAGLFDYYSKINEIPNLAKPNEVTESVLQNCAISFENLTFLKRFDRKCYELTDEGSELEKTSNRSIAFFHNILSKTKVKKIWNKMNTLPKYNSEKGWNLSEDDSLRSKNVDPEDYLPKHFLEKRDKFKRFL